MLSRIARKILLTTERSRSTTNGKRLIASKTQTYSQQQLQLKHKPEMQHQQNNIEAAGSVTNVRLSSCKKYLVLDDPHSMKTEEKKHGAKFPLIWLRDNCQCNKCFHPEVNRRILDWTTFDFDQQVESYKLNEAEDTVHLQWSDGHESTYKLDFFRSHRFDKAASDEYLRTDYRLPKVPWSRHATNFQMPHYSLEEILYNPDGKEMKRWLTGLCETGMGVLENPRMNDRPDLMTEFIKKMFGFCKETHYGTEFLIQNRVADITNVAYLNGNLQLHTDLPYYEYVPGVTMLHYLKQSQEGGRSLLVDGFQVAERLRKEHPEAFETLTTVPVNWVDKGVENDLKFHKILRTPVIALADGKLDRIKFSVPQRDSLFSVSDPKLVQRWYEAMKLFIKLSQEEVLEFKMRENDFLTFDNTRLLHGRTAYEANEHRTLVGCYVDWDEIYSKYRANEN